jgi:hypothetical protein
MSPPTRWRCRPSRAATSAADVYEIKHHQKLLGLGPDNDQ